MMQKSIKLFTHTDLDGIGCAIVAKVYAHDIDADVHITYCQNDEVDEAVRKYISTSIDLYDECFITDLSVSKETAELIDRSDKNIKLLDHHIGAVWLDEYKWANVSVNQPNSDLPTSGTLMFYEELFPVFVNSRLNDFVHDVNYWDTWMWKKHGLEMPKLYSTLLSIKGRDQFIAEILPKLLNQTELPEGWKDIMKKEEDKKRAYIADKENRTFDYIYDGNKYLVVFAGNHISELGNTLSEKHRKYAGVIIFNEGSISLRTCRNDIDLSALAKKFNGGGHKQAAGFVISEDKKKRIMDLIFEEDSDENNA